MLKYYIAVERRLNMTRKVPILLSAVLGSLVLLLISVPFQPQGNLRVSHVAWAWDGFGFKNVMLHRRVVLLLLS